MDWSNPLIFIVPSIAIAAAIGKLLLWIGTQNESVGAVKKSLRKLEDNSDQILLILAPEAKGSSPLQLTELGDRIAESIGSIGVVTEVYKNLVNRTKEKTPYQVQKICLDYMENEFSPSVELKEAIENCAFENGVLPRNIRRVIAILVRNALLEINSEEGTRNG